MENVIKGWVTSLIGLVGMIATFLHATGIYPMPSTGLISNLTECIIGFLVSLALFILPKSRIEALVDKVISRKSDQV